MISASVLAISIGFFFWILASSKLSELAKWPNVGFGGSSMVDSMLMSVRLCSEVCWSDEYAVFKATTHSRRKDPKGSA